MRIVPTPVTTADAEIRLEGRLGVARSTLTSLREAQTLLKGDAPVGLVGAYRRANSEEARDAEEALERFTDSPVVSQLKAELSLARAALETAVRARLELLHLGKLEHEAAIERVEAEPIRYSGAAWGLPSLGDILICCGLASEYPVLGAAFALLTAARIFRDRVRIMMTPSQLIVRDQVIVLSTVSVIRKFLGGANLYLRGEEMGAPLKLKRLPRSLERALTSAGVRVE